MPSKRKQDHRTKAKPDLCDSDDERDSSITDEPVDSNDVQSHNVETTTPTKSTYLAVQASATTPAQTSLPQHAPDFTALMPAAVQAAVREAISGATALARRAQVNPVAQSMPTVSGNFLPTFYTASKTFELVEDWICRDYKLAAAYGCSKRQISLLQIPTGKTLVDPTGTTEYVKWDQLGYVS